MRDPAFNFYSDNFLSGTMFFSDEQVGKYIRLLCAQHQTGHLEEKHMIFICKGYDEDIWNKFKKDDNGRYYNERLELEIEKRKRYCESRSLNKKGKKKTEKNDIISESYDNHMGNGIGNGIGIEDINKKGIKEKNNKPEWKTNFEVYRKETELAWGTIVTAEYLKERETYHPGLDIKMTLTKAYTDYWIKEEGWHNKKKSRGNTINWKTTINNCLSNKLNQVWKPKPAAGENSPNFKYPSMNKSALRS